MILALLYPLRLALYYSRTPARDNSIAASIQYFTTCGTARSAPLGGQSGASPLPERSRRNIRESV